MASAGVFMSLTERAAEQLPRLVCSSRHRNRTDRCSGRRRRRVTEIVHRTVEANGIPIHFAEAGSGPLVLFCHGFPESWYSWRHQLSALADAGFHAVAMDMRGYGRSSKPAAVADYRITELVADCVGVVHALGEPTAVIVGHDWGA